MHNLVSSYSKLSTDIESNEDDYVNFGEEYVNHTEPTRNIIRVHSRKRQPYSDFQTIDWLKDLTFVPTKLRNNENARLSKRIKAFFAKIIYSASGWIAVTLVGMITGLVALLMVISINWLTDIRMGYCRYNIFLDQKDCEWLDGLDINNTNRTPRWITYYHLFSESGYSGRSANVLSGFIYVSLSLFFGVFSAFMVMEIAPYACNSGVAEVKTILGGFVIHGFLGFFTAAVKSFGIVLSVSSGLNIGYESPLIHIGTAVGNLISRLFPKYKNSEAKKREILTAGASAGISAAFNAPISGLLFSFEEATYYFSFKTMWRTFWCTLIAALFRFHLYNVSNSSVFFITHPNSTWKMFELIPFAIIGILGGLFGCCFIKLSFVWSYLRKNSKFGNYPIIEITVLLLIMSIISYIFPLARMNNHRLMSQLNGDCTEQRSFPSVLCDFVTNSTNPISSDDNTSSNLVEKLSYEITQLLYILILKMMFCLFSISLKLPSGFMYPLMIIGAITGRIISHLVNIISLKYPYIFPLYPSCQKGDGFCVDPFLYTIIGAAAFLCGVTRLTVTIVVIIIEITESAVYIVPIMVAVIISKLVGEAIVKVNIFQKSIELNNYPFLNLNTEHKIVGTLSQILEFKKKRSNNNNLTIFTEFSIKISDIQHTFDLPFYSYPIVEDLNYPVLIGSITSYDLFRAYKILSSAYGNINPSMEVSFSQDTNTLVTDDGKLSLYNYVNRSPYSVTPDISIDVLTQHFIYLGLHCVFVTYHGQLIDVITKKDLISYINGA